MTLIPFLLRLACSRKNDSEVDLPGKAWRVVLISSKMEHWVCHTKPSKVLVGQYLTTSSKQNQEMTAWLLTTVCVVVLLQWTQVALSTIERLRPPVYYIAICLHNPAQLLSMRRRNKFSLLLPAPAPAEMGVHLQQQRNSGVTTTSSKSLSPRQLLNIQAGAKLSWNIH